MPPTSASNEEEANSSNVCKSVMNCFYSNNEKNIREVIDIPFGEYTPMNQIIKILVVGPGDSGKSTIMKQMRVIHGNNYTEEERKKYKPIIIQNIFDSIVRLVEAMKLFSINFENESNQQNYELVLKCYENIKINDFKDWYSNSNKYCEIIQSIWNDPSIKICYQRRNSFYLNDSTLFFIDHLNRICSPQYIPDLDDLLRVRQPTTAIQEYKFKISDTYFLFVDVGGQRSERRKWINCFDNITSLLFVSSLSDYDLKLSKDELKSSNSNEHEEVNRMQEGLNLFSALINWKKKVYNKPINTLQRPEVTDVLLFEKVSIILFLNKEDLFEEKFRRSSIKSCFKDYVETDSADKAKEFILNKFIQCDQTLNSKKSRRDIYWHYTFALDRRCIETVVTSVRDRILKFMLESMRL